MSNFTDGSVISSAQESVAEFEKSERTLPMVGVIIAVRPSDNANNASASGNPLFRGCRHECVVLAAPDLGQPNVLLENVIIPPMRHSGIDNFEEDLPRGVSGMVIQGQTYNADLLNMDLTQLDGEWCVVGFVGGKIYQPFIQGWWPHPVNVFDQSTSGNTPPSQGAKPWLTQYDLKKNRGRRLWRNNGTLFLVNREGSIYLDTTQAARSASLDQTGKLQASQVAKGGHAQLDLKEGAQLEINWNTKPTSGPQIGAASKFQTTVAGESVGSTPSAVFESDLPQTQPLPSPTPTVPPRATARTIIQGTEYEVIVKTGKLVLAAQAGTAAGEIDLLVDALLKLKSGGSINQEAAAIWSAKAGANMTQEAVADWSATAGGQAVLAAQSVILNAPSVSLGGAGIVEPLPLGFKWQSMMGQLIDAIKAMVIDITSGVVTPPSQAALEAIKATIVAGDQLSKAVFTK